MWTNVFISGLLVAAASLASANESTATGRAIAFARDRGNCLACHVIADGDSPGNLGPPLQGLSRRYADKAALHAKIWDASQFNPETSMPPFGRRGILRREEIDAIVDYLWSLD